ncbi:hypothetical protein J437_LFUL011326 [Ladona fulva]|uniref:RING-type E3 ubiquitin transferase n=1 Tax=Ladona fulva TaxID=123851 RepID=A0A8K0KCW4_LADFU|nr:hypothetical protein J437_LFUL011326 [Ladona fulva]
MLKFVVTQKYIMSHSKFHSAGQAEILRAAQKDESYILQIHDIISQLSFLGGRKLWLKYATYYVAISRLLYFLSTNARWLQTLGEEYTGIIPVENNSLNLLSFKKMLLYVILLSGGNVILTNLLKKIERISLSSVILNPAPKKGMNKFFHILKNIIPYLEKINKTIFYFNGSYYSVVNRLTGVKHVLVRSWLRDQESLYGFKILAVLSLLNLILSFAIDFSNFSNLESDVELYTGNGAERASIQKNCKLCLNPRKSTSVTPCGHLFCWRCIMEWLQLRKDCPFCKSPISISRVVLLQNYDQFNG